MAVAIQPSELCFVGFALQGAADQLARSDDALKQLWPVTGHSCPLSELWLYSAKSGVLSKKIFEDVMSADFSQEKICEILQEIVP
jgi:hypothetical protein